MKAAKAAVLAFACLAMVLSIAPLIAQTDTQDYSTPASGGGSGSGILYWTVTCNYDANGKFIGKSCTSNGDKACSCPM